MNYQINICLATTISMMMTFVLNCVLHQTRVDGSLIQEYAYDVMGDYLLAFRCWLNDSNSM